MRSVSERDAPPLARLLSGGRGGEVRLRLYLTLVMQATRAPHTLPARTGAGYARLLDLDQPAGARRVAQALKWLTANELISRSARVGKTDEITVLDPGGSGDEWGPVGSRWVTVPIDFWSGGWILELSARAVAVYLLLRELTGGSKDPVGEFMAGHRKRQYGMSDDTWTRATKELVAAGPLQIVIEPVGDDEHVARVRRRYSLPSIPPLY